MAYQYILLEKQGHIAYVTLNRPEKLNALSNDLQGDLVEAMRQIEYDEEVRVVVLKGAGRAFSAGYDINPANRPALDDHPNNPVNNIRVDIQNMSQRTSDRFGHIWNLSKPVIAQIHGYCLAGGTDLALTCDLIVVAEDATIGFPPVRAMGSPPTHMWTYLVGVQWAKYMLLTGSSIDGKTAERIGLALKAVPADQLDDTVNELAGVMARIPWELLAANKSICNKAVELMGRRMLQELAIENDAIAHRAPIVKEFARRSKEEGLKAALDWRDGPFRDYRGSRLKS